MTSQRVCVCAHHAVLPGVHPRHGGALGAVAVAEAAAPHHQLVQGVVILLQHVVAPVQKVVAQRVELREVDAQVGDAQQLCGGGGGGGALIIITSQYITSHYITSHYITFSRRFSGSVGGELYLWSIWNFISQHNEFLMTSKEVRLSILSPRNAHRTIKVLKWFFKGFVVLQRTITHLLKNHFSLKNPGIKGSLWNQKWCLKNHVLKVL